MLASPVVTFLQVRCRGLVLALGREGREDAGPPELRPSLGRHIGAQGHGERFLFVFVAAGGRVVRVRAQGGAARAGGGGRRRDRDGGRGRDCKAPLERGLEAQGHVELRPELWRQAGEVHNALAVEMGQVLLGLVRVTKARAGVPHEAVAKPELNLDMATLRNLAGSRAVAAVRDWPLAGGAADNNTDNKR